MSKNISKKLNVFLVPTPDGLLELRPIIGKDLEMLNTKLCENCPYNKPDMDGDVCSKCEEALNTIEKKLKALEIIKEIKCNVSDFMTDKPTWEEVLKDCDYWFNKLPSKEEYDLLSEELL